MNSPNNKVVMFSQALDTKLINEKHIHDD